MQKLKDAEFSAAVPPDYEVGPFLRLWNFLASS